MASATDTIAALATPPGEGGIAIVRLSGPHCAEVAGRVLRRSDGTAPLLQPRQASFLTVVDPDSEVRLDEALVLWMPAPTSYTREDVLELQCHGGAAASHAVLESVLRCRVRLAEPGEFTLRAFLNGRLDLVQAEAVLDVIQARTAESLQVHEELLAGRLSTVIEGWQRHLGEVLSYLEAHLDFSDEEDVGDPDPARIVPGLTRLLEEMDQRLQTYAWGRRSREGYRVALVGAPNTGKSSLLNAMLDEERAIVSETAGTTRDAIDAWVSAHGLPVQVMDTAGLRDSLCSIEQQGVARSRAAALSADLVLWISDGSRDMTDAEVREGLRLGGQARVLPVVNKCDMGERPAEALAELFGESPLAVSAIHGRGVSALLLAVRQRAWGGGGPSNEAPLTRERQRVRVEAAVGCVRRALEQLCADGYLEVAASELHAARRQLAELLGWGGPEDVLERVFSEFCVGK